MNTKRFFCFCLLFQVVLLLSSCMILLDALLEPESEPPPKKTMELDKAVESAARKIEGNVKEGQKIALLNFNSPSERFSEYVLEELSSQLVHGKKLIVVDRKELDLIRQEEQFQASGDVSDESALALGRKLGAGLIVSGSLTALGDVYRFRVRVLNVESAAIEASPSADIDPQEKKVNFLLEGKGAIQLNTGSRQAAVSLKSPSYGIGDSGPARGIIFYDKGIFSNGWQYLEAAPAETEFTATWGYYDNVPGTRRNTGEGKKNTELIVEELRRWGENGQAAQLCIELNINGYNDWFLPSFEELELIFKNLKQKGLGNFSDKWYWSSTYDEKGEKGDVWYLRFNDGHWYSGPDYKALSVRAIRAF